MDTLTQIARKNEAVMATVARIRSRLVDAYNEAVIRNETSEAEVCRRMEVTPSEFRKALLGSGDLSFRTIGMIAYGLDVEIEFVAVPREQPEDGA